MAGAAVTYNVIQTRAEAIAEVKRLRAEAVVYFDCEMVHVGNQPQIALVQACADTGPVCLFDCTSNISGSGILDLLKDEKITKVMHDCRLECSTFFKLFGVEIKNIFDTQIAYRALDAKARGTTMSRAKLASFSDVCSSVGVTLDLSVKQNIKYWMDLNPLFWATRPLTDDMKTYAVMDVKPLIAIYPKLKARLAGSGYEAFFHNMCDEYRYMAVDATRARQLRRQREKLELLNILQFNPHYPLTKVQKQILAQF